MIQGYLLAMGASCTLQLHHTVTSKYVISFDVMCRRRPLGRLAELYSRLLHGADLSPSDEFISLILLSAAQRKSRQTHIRNALKLHRKQAAAAKQEADKADRGQEDGKAPPPPPSHDPSRHPSQSAPPTSAQMVDSRTAESPVERLDSDAQPRSYSESQSEAELRSAMQEHAESQDLHSSRGGAVHSSVVERSDSDIGEEMQDTLNMIHTPNAADGPHPSESPHQSSTGAEPAASQAASQQDEDSHVIDMPGHESLPAQCSASSVHGDAPAGGKVKRRSQPASSKKADVQDLKDMEEGGPDTHNQTADSRKTSRRRLNQDEFFKHDFMLAPSSYATEYEPDVAPDKLADIYTGQKLSRAFSIFIYVTKYKSSVGSCLC